MLLSSPTSGSVPGLAMVGVISPRDSTEKIRNQTGKTFQNREPNSDPRPGISLFEPQFLPIYERSADSVALRVELPFCQVDAPYRMVSR
jgi:hypothetical protein